MLLLLKSFDMMLLPVLGDVIFVFVLVFVVVVDDAIVAVVGDINAYVVLLVLFYIHVLLSL